MSAVKTRNGFTSDERPGFSRWGTFEITEDHLKLVQQSNWYWNICEWGAPAMDGKRPYGNGDLYKDMCQILGIEDMYDTKTGEFRQDLTDRLWSLHCELHTVFEISCKFMEFKTGKWFRKEPYHEWQPETAKTGEHRGGE